MPWPSKVYFVRADTAVKIGFAINIAARIQGLQTGCPVPLQVFRTVLGGREEERWLHRRYADLRLHGEWFEFCPDMLTVEIGNPPADFSRPCTLAGGHPSVLSASLLASLRSDVQEIIGVSPGATLKTRLGEAAQLLRLPLSRVEDWWYGEVKRPGALDGIRPAAAADRSRLHRRRGLGAR